MPGNTEQGRYIEFAGAEEVVPAIRQLLLSPRRPDLVVVRNMVKEPEILEILAENRPDEIDVLYDTVPELDAVTPIVHKYWRRSGYRDGLISERLTAFGNGIHSRELHLDDSPENGIIDADSYPEYGPLALSIGVRACASFGAIRPIGSLKTRRGNFSVQKWHHLNNSAPGREPTRVTQYPGDGIFWMNHPEPTLHEVTVEEGRVASLYDFGIVRKPTDKTR